MFLFILQGEITAAVIVKLLYAQGHSSLRCQMVHMDANFREPNQPQAKSQRKYLPAQQNSSMR